MDLQEEDGFDQTCFMLDQLTAELTKPCIEEERMNYTVYKAAQFEHVIRENRSTRVELYGETRKALKKEHDDRDYILREIAVEELASAELRDAEYYR